MLNSAIVGVLSTALEIVFALLAAYAIVFIPFRAKKVVFLLMMATMMIPGEVLVITNFQTIRSWDMLNTYQGLILPGLASTFGIFLFRQNMLQIPLELKEASTVAGVSEFGFFWKIVAPMVVNTVVTLAIYFFLVSWNSYMWPLLSTTEDTVRTVQIGLRQLKNTEAVSDYGMMAAGAMVTSLPTPTAHLLRAEAAAGGHDERRYKIIDACWRLLFPQGYVPFWRVAIKKETIGE